MLSVIVQSPSASVVRRLANQRWQKGDEILVFPVPGSEGSTAWQLARDAGAFGSAATRSLSEPIDRSVPGWDWAITGIKEATQEFIWLLPEGSIPFPNAVWQIENRLFAKPLCMSAYSPHQRLLPPPSTSDTFGPRDITASCIVAPRGLAQLSVFEPSEWGAAAWANEMAALQKEPIERVGLLIAGRDVEQPFIEKRIDLSWSLFPTPNIFPDSAHDTAFGFVTPVGDSGYKVSLVPLWRGRGLFVPMLRFVLQLAGGQTVWVQTLDCTRDAEPNGSKSPTHMAMQSAGFMPYESTSGDSEGCSFMHPGLLHV